MPGEGLRAFCQPKNAARRVSPVASEVLSMGVVIGSPWFRRAIARSASTSAVSTAMPSLRYASDLGSRFIWKTASNSWRCSLTLEMSPRAKAFCMIGRSHARSALRLATSLSERRMLDEELTAEASRTQCQLL